MKVTQGQLPEMVVSGHLSVGSFFCWGETPPCHGILCPAGSHGDHSNRLRSGAFLLWHALPGEVKGATPGYRTSDWLRALKPLWWINILTMVSGKLDFLWLGAVRSPEEVAFYTAAGRGAMAVGVPLLVVNSLGPRLAVVGGWRTAPSAKTITLVAVDTAGRAILLLALILFGQVLGWFGRIYRRSRRLVILCLVMG